MPDAADHSRPGEGSRPVDPQDGAARLRALVADVARIAQAAVDRSALLTRCLERLGRELPRREWFVVLGGRGLPSVLDEAGPSPEAVSARVLRILRAPDPGSAAGVRAIGATARRRAWLVCLHAAGSPPPDPLALDAVAAVLGGHLRRIELAGTLRRALERPREHRRHVEARTSADLRAHRRRLEGASHALLEGERRLLDAERQERVDHLAAGVAHAINNPLGSLLANLDFAQGLVRDLAHAVPPTTSSITELGEALGDAIDDARRIGALVQTRLAEAARDRRAVVGTEVAHAVADALDHLGHLEGRALAVKAQTPLGLVVGVGRRELARWLFRLLSTAGLSPDAPVAIDATQGGQGVRLALGLPPAAAEAVLALETSLRAEVENAGCRLELLPGGAGPRVVLDLPADLRHALRASRRPA